jgi:multidrug efflux pump subunit AcrA (membrane-fusion protein)
MKRILLTLSFPLMLCANVYYAKVEPFLTTTVKSAVSGEVLDVALEQEGKMLDDNRTIVWIDDRLDKVNLTSTKARLKILQSRLLVNQESLEKLLESKKRQKRYYQRLSKLSTSSQTQKDNAYGGYVSKETQYLNTKEKILTLQQQQLDLEDRQAQLEDQIAKKQLHSTHRYLYKLMVHKGDFVAPGTPLAVVQDLSRAKLVLFLEPEVVERLSASTLYLNGKKSDYRVNKVWQVSDEKYLSSYRAEIYIDAKAFPFSRLIQVEIK